MNCNVGSLKVGWVVGNRPPDLLSDGSVKRHGGRRYVLDPGNRFLPVSCISIENARSENASVILKEVHNNHGGRSKIILLLIPYKSR